MSKNRRLLLGHLLSSTALVGASAVGLTVTAPVGSALADCSTGMPMPGQIDHRLLLLALLLQAFLPAL
jgi:hypothetical protein